MAHYAELNENNEVIYVTYMDNEIIADENGNEIEELGIQHLHNHHGPHRRWVRTSYNANFRGKYAIIGDIYDEENDTFEKCLYPSWSINKTNGKWEAPILKPSGYFHDYEWIEEQQSWFSIKEYVYETYGKLYNYEDISECCEKFNLSDNTIIPVLSDENYTIQFEKIKNFISCHVFYQNWTTSIIEKWNIDYAELKKKANCDLYALHKIPDQEERDVFSKYMENFTQFSFLEEKNSWAIYKQNKFGY